MVVKGSVLRDMRKKLGYSQLKLAEKLSVSRNTVYDWERDAYFPEGKNLIKLAAALNTTAAYLLGETTTDLYIPVNAVAQNTTEAEASVEAKKPAPEKEKQKSNVRFGRIMKIPLLSIEMVANCGIGNDLSSVDAEPPEMFWIDSSCITRTDDMHPPFAIRCDGDSMEDAGITEGSTVVINPAEDIINGDPALVVWNDCWFIKWVVFNPDGSVELRSANPAYAPIKVDKEYAEDPQWFRVIGKVVRKVEISTPKRAF